MKFFCEYCGNRIDAEKNSKCPNCGASYKKNKSFIKLEEEKKKQIQTNQENAQKIFNHVFGVFKISRIMFFIPVFIFIIIIVIAIITTSKINKNKPKYNNNDFGEIYEEIIDETEKEEQKEELISVGIDEFAETKEYKVKVTKYEVEEDIFNRLDEDYEYVKFYLLVENLTDSRITKEDVNCIVDGIAQTNYYSSGYSDLPMFINKNLTVKGEATFEVPKNAKSYDIRYGDYVTIHIEK